MMEEKDISERNKKLIKFITELDLGIHVIDLPEKPRFVSKDFTKLLNGYVKNFKIILTNMDWDGEPILQCRVDDNPQDYKQQFVEWMEIYNHKKIHTIGLRDYPMLSVCGWNHHDKINKLSPYPVFSKYFPQIYYELGKAEEIAEKFSEYNLFVK